MAIGKLLNLLVKYRIEDYVIYVGPAKDRNILMKIYDIIDTTYDDPVYGDYELVLLEPNKTDTKDELWAKYEDVRPLTKKEAKLIRLLYE